MKSRTWFLLSLLLFAAAAFFWRFGDERRVAQQNARQQSAMETKQQALKTAAASTKTAASKSLLAEPPSKNAATNAQPLYPNRLSNTTKTIDQLTRDNRAILLRNALIDTAAGRVNVPDYLRSKGDPGSYIVQSRGPLTDLFRAELRAAQAEVISYVPNNAYLVRMARGNVEKLMGNKDVQAVLPYEPYYKLDSALLDMVVKKEALPLDKLVRVTWFPGQMDAGLEKLQGNAAIIKQDLKSSPFGPESIISMGDLVALANLNEVQGIEPFSERILLNDLTRVRLGISTNSLTTTLNHQGLSGANVLVNVNDTPIDNTHPDLIGRIFPGAGVATIDVDGHGTLVAGIIASSGLNGPNPSTNASGSATNASFRGKADQAQIFSLDIFAGFSDSELQETAARTNLFVFNRKSPLISNNSWGRGERTYDSAAASYDMAVRDAIPGVPGSQPVIYVFAAGNAGGGSSDGQGGSPRTVTTPATAKNVITVGALESPRFITNDIIRKDASCVTTLTNKEFLGNTDSSNQVAFFSSRGNVGVSQEGTYGRFKPDVVAPGTFIVSTRSQQFDEADYYSTTNYIVNTFPGLVIEPGATNRFSLFVPEDPCDQGNTLSFTIATLRNGNSPSPFPPLQIFVDTAQAPSATPANFVGTNSVTLVEGDPKFTRGTVFYDIVNTNSIAVGYDLYTQILVTNDFGNFFTTLKGLNDKLGTNYFYESGTSMAAPAISGMLALMQEFFEQTLPAGSRRTNSPAMMKALLINCARTPNELLYKLDGSSAVNIPGWGLPNLARALPGILATAPTNEWPIQMFDQSTNGALATGETYTRNVTVTDTNSALRVTLVWTDPPGNPQVGVKLVNDLDLVVKTLATGSDGTNTITTTNVYFGNNFSGGSQFTTPIEVGTNSAADFEAARDVVNNVENVYINGPLGATYEVSVVARRVNVNAVTGHTNNTVQDYALVISSGNLTTNAPFAVVAATPPPAPDTRPFVTGITNGQVLLNQRAGANSPLLNINATGLTDGVTNQWRFFVLNNPSNFANVAFLTFLPPNLSGTTNVSPNSRRNKEADIDMYVSTDASLTNLNPTALANADKSRTRGGQELVIYTNATASAFYVGVKSEDQQASDFAFYGIASQFPFSNRDQNGNLILRNTVIQGQNDIPDGSPESPGGAYFFAFATEPIEVVRVVVTNIFTSELIGDLLGTLTHGQDAFAVLNNHSFPVSPGYPDGQESGTFVGIYDDSELSGTDGILNSRPTDGPGSLNDFVGQEGVGAWILTMEDSALNATGRVDFLSLMLEPSLDTDPLFDGRSGFTISTVVIPPNSSRALTFTVPEDATNMIISIAPKEGPIDTVVRRGLQSPTRDAPGGPYVDEGKLINPPGDSFSVGLTNNPPLQPGRYSMRLFNDGGSPVTVSGLVVFELNLSAAAFQTYASGGTTAILDDAVTNSIIHVNRTGRVVDVDVGVRIDHPRVSDLVLHLISPDGTRILLTENRGGYTTNYGFSSLTTNVFPASSSGGPSADTNTIPLTQNNGVVNVSYDFFNVPDQLQIFYDGLLLYDTGLISGAGSLSVPFGPGLSTNVVIVMNGNGNPSPTTAWEYTVTILSGQFVYATFSENTNLALVPIKFAIPPFATNFPGSNVVNFLAPDGGFETVAPGNYTTTVEGWTVTTNSVDVIGNSAVAYAGSNYLDLGGSSLPASGSDIIAGPITNTANGHIYYLLTGTNWTASQAQAVALGGNLVTINNADEHAWVYSTFSSFGGTSRALWIGLSDHAQEGNFVWAGGQTSAYRNWATFEPNGFDVNEDYVHILPPSDPLNRGGKWNDYGNVTHIIYGFDSVPHHGVVEVDPGIGGISRTLPTTAGGLYNLKFAYRGIQPGDGSRARVGLEGLFTNDFVGNSGWILHSATFGASKSGTKLDILGTSFQTINATFANGSFESGLAGWSANAAIIISPHVPSLIPATHGTKAVQIGIGDVPGSILSQTFSAGSGYRYVVSFDILGLGDPGRVSIVRVDLVTGLGLLVSQTFTNAARNTPPFVYQTNSIPFTMPLGATSVTLHFVDLSPNGGIAVDPLIDNVRITGGESGMLFDSFSLTAGGDPNYFLPEESLKTLIGENARGDWRLEIWDNRAGAPLGASQLLSWKLDLTFASTSASSARISSGVGATNTVRGAEIKYFIVDVPIFASRATNILVSGSGPLNLLFNQDQLPVGNSALGDVTLLPATVNGTRVLTKTTFPALQPGRRYYLGVQNANSAQTNFFTLTVTFDNTNNLLSVTPLQNAVPLSANIPLSSSIQYYQYDLSNSVSAIEFRLYNLSADADLVVRRDQLPTPNVYDYNSNLGGTSEEVITVASPVSGRYYLGVYGFFPTGAITYTVLVTEGPAEFRPTLSSSPTLDASGFHVTANTIIGRKYEFSVSTNLKDWDVLTTSTATANITTFTDPTPPATQTARFYRLRMLP